MGIDELYLIAHLLVRDRIVLWVFSRRENEA